MLSEKLCLQFIVITHLDDIIDNADKIFKIKLRNGQSVVSVV